jgi:hypothetical protein
LLRVYAASRSVACIDSVVTKPGRTFLIDCGLPPAARGNQPRPGQRRTVIPATANVAYRELSGLPSTIRIGPCKLEITCIDAGASGGTLV